MTTYQADPWTALGDPTRRKLLEQLASRPCSVAELAHELPISRPAVSQHLRVLRDAGLVASRPEGTRRIHTVDAAGLRVIRADLDKFWRATLTNLKRIAEESS